MADRRDYYHRQPVTEAELDAGFAGGETADLSLATDWGLALVDASSTDGGIATGLVASLGVGLNLDVTAGAAYDNSGRRVRTASTLSVSQAQTGQTAIGAGGTPTGGVTTDPGLNQERWVMLSMSFDRALSDPRVDGGGATVQFVRAESFRFHVSMGNPAAFGAATRPALPSGQVVLCEILVRNTAGSVAFSGGVDTTRRQDWFVRGSGTTTREGAGYPVRSMRVGLPRAALDHLLGVYNDHVRRDASTGDFHFAKNVEYEGAGLAWANAEAFVGWVAGNGAAGASLAAGVQNAIDEIVRDLGGIGATSGAHRLGTAAIAGTRPADAVGAADAVVADTLTAALTVLLAAVNRAVRLDGDTVTGAIVPSVAGVDLGSAGARFDAFLRNLDLTNIISNVGTGGTDRTLGANSNGNRFTVHLQDATLNATFTMGGLGRLAGDWIPTADGTSLLGDGSRRYSEVYTQRVIAGAPSTDVSVVQALGRVSDSAGSNIIEARNKFSSTREGADAVGHWRSTMGVWRDDFLYATNVTVTGTIVNSWELQFSGMNSTAGFGGFVAIPSTLGYLGNLRLNADRTAGDGTATNYSYAATRTSIARISGASADLRTHFVARVLPIFSTTSRRVFIGWTTAPSDFATNGVPDATALGFRIPWGGTNWFVWRRAATTNVQHVDTGVAFSSTAYQRLELQVLDTTRVYWRVIVEGGATASGIVDTAPTVHPSGVEFIAQVSTDDNLSTGEQLFADYVDLYVS